jgi:hypothetical protein
MAGIDEKSHGNSWIHISPFQAQVHSETPVVTAAKVCKPQPTRHPIPLHKRQNHNNNEVLRPLIPT